MRASQFFSCFLAYKKIFCLDEKGATVLEYVLIIAVLSAVIIVAFSELGQSLVDFFSDSPI